MNIRDFEVFKTIVESQSFSKASEKLFISQPSLSKTIQKLEKRLNVTLFDRSNRIIRLTDEGRLFYEKATNILQELKELTTTLEDMDDHVTGHVKIGLPQIIGTFFFPQVAKIFAEKYKDVTLEIVEEGGLSVEKLLESGEVDVGFVVLPTQTDKLEEQFIYEAPFVACLPPTHPLAKEQDIALTQLQEDPWVMFDPTFALRQVVLNSCHREQFDPTITYSTTQWDLLLALVREGVRVAIVPSPLAEMYSQQFCVKNISSQYIPWKIGVVVRKDRYQSHALQAFLRIVANLYQKRELEME